MIFVDTPIAGPGCSSPNSWPTSAAPLHDVLRGGVRGAVRRAGFPVQHLLQCKGRHAAGITLSGRPHGEAKLVRCTRGGSTMSWLTFGPSRSSFRTWFAIELSEENRKAFFIPSGCAHGFQSLHDGTEVLYQMSAPYVPDAGRGVRWDDPAFGIDWPYAARRADARSSERDASVSGLRAVSTGAGDRGDRVHRPGHARARWLAARPGGAMLSSSSRRAGRRSGQPVRWHRGRPAGRRAPRRRSCARSRASHLLHLAWYAAPAAVLERAPANLALGRRPACG